MRIQPRNCESLSPKRQRRGHISAQGKRACERRPGSECDYLPSPEGARQCEQRQKSEGGRQSTQGRGLSRRREDAKNKEGFSMRRKRNAVTALLFLRGFAVSRESFREVGGLRAGCEFNLIKADSRRGAETNVTMTPNEITQLGWIPFHPLCSAMHKNPAFSGRFYELNPIIVFPFSCLHFPASRLGVAAHPFALCFLRFPSVQTKPKGRKMLHYCAWSFSQIIDPRGCLPIQCPLPHPGPLPPRGRGRRGCAMGVLNDIETAAAL